MSLFDKIKDVTYVRLVLEAGNLQGAARSFSWSKTGMDDSTRTPGGAILLCIWTGSLLLTASHWNEMSMECGFLFVLSYLRFLLSMFLYVNFMATLIVFVIMCCIHVLSLGYSPLVVSMCQMIA